MAKKTSSKKSATPDRQLNLIECTSNDRTVELSYVDFQAGDFKLVIAEKALDKFNEVLEKNTKRGPRYTAAEKFKKRLDFIQKRMRPVEGVKIDGTSWESSVRTFLYKVFKLDWNDDFDDLGQKIGERETIEVEDTETGEKAVIEA